MPTHNGSTTFPIVNVPGGLAAYFPVQQMLNYGRQIRDEYVWCYPILPGAVFTFQQLASNREWKISGSASGASRANEWLHNAKVQQYDGLTFYGFDNFLKARSLDYLAVGRRAFYAPPGGDLEYLDPCYLQYNLQERKWIDTMLNRDLPQEHVIVDHTLPLGATGRFTSPLAMVMPSAMLAWLIREHDAASLDGRRVREVIIIRGKELQESIANALISMINLATDPMKAIEKNNIPIAWTEDDGEGPVQDNIGRLGLTSIPEGFDRKSFIFQFVNEVAAALGLALRHFWNQEQSTNRALEEVQQQRQSTKGPEIFVRSEQRILSNERHKLLRRFGPRTRMAFFEEVDAQSQLNRSNILRNTAEAFKIFNEAAAADGQRLSIESLIAWMQVEGTLPHEMEFKLEEVVEVSDPTAGAGDSTVESDPKPSRLSTGSGTVKGKAPTPGNEKSSDILDYGEVTINNRGEIIDSRVRVFPVLKAVIEEISNDPDRNKSLEAEVVEFDFNTALQIARQNQHKVFLEKIASFNIENPEHFSDFAKLSDSDFHQIDFLLNNEPGTL